MKKSETQKNSLEMKQETKSNINDKEELRKKRIKKVMTKQNNSKNKSKNQKTEHYKD